MAQESAIHTILLSCTVENHPGVAMKITGMFARRGYNITSIVAAPSEKPGISRILIQATGNDKDFEQIQKQMNKMVEVVKVNVLRFENAMIRELALIKITIASDEEQQKIFSYVNMFDGKIIDVSLKQMTIQMADETDKIDSLLEILKRMNSGFEICRTGMIGVYKNQHD